MTNAIATIDQKSTAISARLARRIDKAGVGQIAKMFLAQYPRKEDGDDSYVRHLMDLIAGYPEEIAMTLASARTNPLPGSPFLPGIGQIRDELDKLVAPMERSLRGNQELAAQLAARDEGPSDEERAEIAPKFKQLAEEIKRGPIPEDASEPRKLGWPEWMWDESEQSEKYKELAANFRASQGTPEQVHAARIDARIIRQEETE